MFKKQTFETNIYMKMFRWAYIFLVGNLCFLLVNLPFFLAAITCELDIRNSLFFLVALLFFLPATLTLLAWVHSWYEQKDIDPAKEFFQLYKLCWKRGFVLGIFGWLGTLIAIVDIVFFLRLDAAIGKWVLPFFFLLILFALALTINNFYFQVKNPQASVAQIYQTALYFTLKKWYLSLLNTALILTIPVVMVVKPQFGFTLVPALFVGIIYLNCAHLYKKTFEQLS